ncbi:MAG: hypothetical protein COX02_00240 [Candidatus Vogelbacteria bacterium CG22_combo_CG10-13_8_21_14_all_37_9]|uniref:Uncharacterized protein n=1 Tax=Candidatus Vogelbacteria bacterium CG22_combo_CG10-13_8_21_14_all_37_9 TaxID=1975046 RepID=A0A2H0BN67_9BACT|nr:MAG: hypothetical protein BK005_02250 [bacterium CG10_37_50]PIP58448.1 MAG: hypothetical protein COX02_00240 [Candidatus Vogelbacteria bacterium CG22_combo_CG10-13_8_21_14_all_37_9]
MTWANYLNQLRSKSDNEKRRLAFTYATIGTGIIFVIWLISVAISLSNLGQTITPTPKPAVEIVKTKPLETKTSWFKIGFTKTVDTLDSIAHGGKIAVTKLKTMLK